MPPFLTEVTALLQRLRRADPVDGLWEAADLQWWSRRGAPLAFHFWYDGGTPAGAVVLTGFTASVGFAMIGDCPDALPWLDGQLPGLGLPVTVEIPPSSVDLKTGLEARGFAVDGAYDALWQPAAHRAARPLPEGYAVVDRATFRNAPHWLIGRSGENAEAGLRAAGLYSPALDLAVTDPDGGVAAYALFWADSVTGVGLVEPMRVEAAYGGRGIGSALLAEGLNRLVDAGCSRLKVSVESENTPAVRLYTGAGFVSTTPTLSLARPAG